MSTNNSFLKKKFLIYNYLKFISYSFEGIIQTNNIIILNNFDLNKKDFYEFC